MALNDKDRKLSPLGQRLARLGNAFGFPSWREFAAACEFPNTSEMKKIAESGNPGARKLDLIRRRTGANLNWLVSGDEEDRIQSSPTEEQAAALIAHRTHQRPRKKKPGGAIDPPQLPPSGAHPTAPRSRAR